ncbi:DUF6294 family protein [Amycolatopsis sp. NPDC059657]|uniref:DUF6294 family protein n=1 Tax=Amycolatopsis sp. NPDC059657 TaxID=3346899 RepID=UPI0036707735
MRRRRLSLAVAVLAGSIALAAPAEAAQPEATQTDAAQIARLTTGVTAGVAWKSYTWDRDLHAGDCTMFHGATWTIRADGTASFQGTVTSSDDNDAWLMQAHLLTVQQGQLVQLENAFPDTRERIIFAKNMPDHNRQYPWSTSGGRFPSWYFDRVGSMQLISNC